MFVPTERESSWELKEVDRDALTDAAKAPEVHAVDERAGVVSERDGRGRSMFVTASIFSAFWRPFSVDFSSSALSVGFGV